MTLRRSRDVAGGVCLCSDRGMLSSSFGRALCRLFLGVVVYLPACDSQVDVGTTGNSTATDTTGGTGGSGGGTTSTVTPVPPCTAFKVNDPIISPTIAGNVGNPQLSYDPASGHAVVGFESAIDDYQSEIHVAKTDAFNNWQPTVWDEQFVFQPASSFTLGDSPHGPIAMIVGPNETETFILTNVYPEITTVKAPYASSGESPFIVGTTDWYFFSQISHWDGLEFYDNGSYAEGFLSQLEPPSICSASPLPAAGSLSPTGFFSAVATPNPLSSICDSADPHFTNAITVSHHQIPADKSAGLTRTQGLLLDLPEPIKEVHLSAASFGTWLVYQTNGSTSESMPPVIATRLDFAGNPYNPSEAIVVTPSGVVFEPIAVAPLGDSVAIAWIDAIDPSAPTIVIQVINGDGTLGPIASIPTNSAWYKTGLQMSSAPNGTQLLLTWQAANDNTPQIALARVDCVQ